ncbi:MAG: hypothetical protein GF349_03555 [Candidatus Magasanikbacteria bacterium]|nr:hypothetical protein [Candidatus Magasanikbacteria bacterium]
MTVFREKTGQTLIEVIIAMTIFALISSALITLSVGSFNALSQGGEQTEAEALAQEAIEAIKSIREGAWNEIQYSKSAVSTSTGEWVFVGEGTEEQIGQYRRLIIFDDVCRDANDDIVACPGLYTDIHTKKVTVTVTWEIRDGVENIVERIAYLTNWDSHEWVQRDWSGGSGQPIWSDITRYYTDDGNINYSTAGEVKLAGSGSGGSACAGYTWNFSTSSGYSFNPSEIEVVSGTARLAGEIGDSGGIEDGTFSSSTNTDYDWPFTTAGNYTYDSDKIQITGGVAELVPDQSVFRIKEYYIGSGQFSGNSYNLTLDQDLADNYFVIVRGSDGDGSSTGNRGPDENYIALTADPNGTGDLGVSGANDRLTFTRNNSVDGWIGVVTVVECLQACSSAGFELLDVQDISHGSGVGSGTDNSGTSWSDIDQVMIMAGFNGSGCRTPETSNGNNDVCHIKYWPSSSNVINWERNYTGNSANSTAMVLEWGSEWTVQRVNITGTAGGNGANAIGEYNTASISSVSRVNTWVWGVGYTTDDGIGDSAEGTLITLGNGVAENLSESQVAVGQEYTDNKNFEVYALTHDDLTVDYRFKADGDSGNLTYDQDVDIVNDDSARMALSYNGCNGTGGAWPRPIFSARYLDDDTVRLERRRSGQPFPAWVQGINFSGIESTGSSSTTLNPGFDVDASNWGYSDWDQGGGEVDVTGYRATSGGNPGGYAEINIPSGGNDEVGGFGYQAFTVSEDNPIVTLDFDWQVSAYDATPDTFQLYVFVDSSAGAPTIGQEVWSSGEISATQGWTSQVNIDASSKVTTAGTYYLKIAVWVETPGGPGTGPFTIGYDNILLTWEYLPDAMYPTDNPDIYPNSSYSASGVQSWDSFTETAIKGTGEIYYQLTIDNGINWYYWGGSSWDVAGVMDYNTASVIDTNISSLSTSGEQIKFKAFLESDGTSQVRLDNINIGIIPDWVWAFSDWGVGGGEVTPVGSYQSSGGNPGGYADITVPQGTNDEVGGYWEQAFTTTQDDPNVTIDFDYRVLDYNSTPDLAEIRVYLDTSSGAPSNQVGSSITVSGEGGWTGASQIDASSAVSSAGTYYLKMALWVETGNNDGPYTVGFDNVDLNWEAGGYPDNIPGINPVASYEPSSVDTWTGISVSSTKNGGEVYFQISDDDGSTWYYWGGSSWDVAGAGDYNTTSTINENLWQFDADEGKIMFKAFLESDGTHQVTIDDVELSCANLQMEVGTVSTDENWTDVDLENTYSSPIIVTSYYESNNTAPASVRIRNVTSTGFDVRLQNPSALDLSSDQITYFVIEEGKWDVDGIKIEADKYDTNTVGENNNWTYDSLSFAQSFSVDPIVLHQVMTNNDSTWISTYVSRDTSQSDPPDTDGMRIALNGAEAVNSHGTETIGWVAVEANSTGTISGTDFETYRTTDTVLGHDNGCYPFSYQNSYSASPLLLGFQQEMDGTDGSWSVTCNNSSSQGSFHAEEDQVSDSERGHTSETYGFVAFAEAFDYSSSAICTGSFVDNTESEFDNGSYSNTEYDTDRVELTGSGMSAGSGTYTSDIFNSGGVSTWTSISWVPFAPYQKSLPDNGSLETVYTEDNFNMANNQALFHFDESSGSVSFDDGSSNGNDAACYGTVCPTVGSAGRIGSALDFDGSQDYVTSTADLNQWLGDTASVSYWIKTTQVGDSTFWDAPGITGVEQSGGGNDIFWGWIDDNGYIGFKVGDGNGVQSNNAINDDNWHHIFMTRNSSTGLIKLYVDGEFQNQITSDTGTKTTSFYSIGRIEDTGGTPKYFDGLVDEFSIWDTILGDDDIRKIYLRGALRIKYQVRSCNDGGCLGESFVGPDGTASTYYSEADNYTTSLPSFNLTNLSDNQYFQYQAILETSSSTLSPKLSSFTVNYSGSCGGGGGAYVGTGSLQSSAYDMSSTSSIQTIEWDETIPICTPDCEVKLQLRAAPDSGGTPGTWTDWYGASGVLTYFTSSTGSLVPINLNGYRWVQYRAELIGDGSNTPVLEEVRVNYRN